MKFSSGKIRIGQAIALNRRAQKLFDEGLENLGPEATDEDVAENRGAMLAALILGPFAMELALKSILFQLGLACKEHDLLKIWEKIECLRPEIVEEIEQRFRKRRVDEPPEFRKEQIKARQVVTDWKDGFTEWRYLAEMQDPPKIPHVRGQRGPILVGAILDVSRNLLEQSESSAGQSG